MRSSPKDLKRAVRRAISIAVRTGHRHYTVSVKLHTKIGKPYQSPEQIFKRYVRYSMLQFLRSDPAVRQLLRSLVHDILVQHRTNILKSNYDAMQRSKRLSLFHSGQVKARIRL